MSETNSRMRANMEKVLRVMDIIPPFDGQADSSSSGGDDILHESESGEITPLDDLMSLRRPVRRMSTAKTSARPADDHVPTLDLGEKILAEQRRRTADTRRGPGVSKPVSEPEPEMEDVEQEMLTSVSVATSETDAEGVAQLHDIVADIVARDIERLCRGLKRAVCC